MLGYFVSMGILIDIEHTVSRIVMGMTQQFCIMAIRMDVELKALNKQHRQNHGQ